MSNVINVAEHDYATYTIINAMQTEDGGETEPQIVYQVQEFLPEDQVSIADVAYDETYQYITTETAENVENSNSPRYRREPSGLSGYWDEVDVVRLLKIYLKHVKPQRQMRGKPNLATWNAIYREFDTKKKFTKAQIKTKILRLRNIGKNILKNGEADKTLWPFWKLVSEILQMENNKEPTSRPKLSEPWDQNDFTYLIGLYEHFLETTGGTADEIFEKIAKEMEKPANLITGKFSKFKSKWKKWHALECPNSDPLLLAYLKYDGILAKTQNGDETEESPEISREKWSRAETERLLAIYIELLNGLQSSTKIYTRRAVYKTISRRISIPVDVIQVKITSLKGHYRKYIMTPAKERTNWRYAKSLEKIASLENAIWNQVEETPVESPVEPEWFRSYRADVERRHVENMTVLEKLLTVFHQILESDFD